MMTIKMIIIMKLCKGIDKKNPHPYYNFNKIIMTLISIIIIMIIIKMRM